MSNPIVEKLVCVSLVSGKGRRIAARVKRSEADRMVKNDGWNYCRKGFYKTAFKVLN